MFTFQIVSALGFRSGYVVLMKAFLVLKSSKLQLFFTSPNRKNLEQKSSFHTDAVGSSWNRYLAAVLVNRQKLGQTLITTDNIHLYLFPDYRYRNRNVLKQKLYQNQH